MTAKPEVKASKKLKLQNMHQEVQTVYKYQEVQTVERVLGSSNSSASIKNFKH